MDGIIFIKLILQLRKICLNNNVLEQVNKFIYLRYIQSVLTRRNTYTEKL
jgi:hypothetical protein